MATGKLKQTRAVQQRAGGAVLTEYLEQCLDDPSVTHSHGCLYRLTYLQQEDSFSQQATSPLSLTGAGSLACCLLSTLLSTMPLDSQADSHSPWPAGRKNGMHVLVLLWKKFSLLCLKKENSPLLCWEGRKELKEGGRRHARLCEGGRASCCTRSLPRSYQLTSLCAARASRYLTGYL